MCFYMIACILQSESAILTRLCHWCIVNSDRLFIHSESRSFWITLFVPLTASIVSISKWMISMVWLLLLIALCIKKNFFYARENSRTSHWYLSWGGMLFLRAVGLMPGFLRYNKRSFVPSASLGFWHVY